jgi:ABC-type amino acid transport substrate-binding protein
MITTKSRALIALLALLALFAGACASDDGDDTATDDTAVDADADADAETDADGDAEGDADTGDLGLATEGQLLVGSDINFAPFEFYEGDVEMGFDIDLLNEIADRVGVETTYENVSFDTIFTQLAAGQYDAIISAITITEERDETIDFSSPYFSANQALAGAEGGSVSGVADLTGDLVVAVQSGTTGEDYAEANFTDVTIDAFPSSTDAFNALAAGQVDAVFIDIPVVQEQVATGDVVLLEEVVTGELYGIGVPEGNSALKDAIDDALAEMIEDGTYAEIFSTWFPDDDVDLAISAIS